MTHLSDGLSVGGAFTNTLCGSSGGFGINTVQNSLLNIVPITKNTAAYNAAPQSATSAATLTLSANGSGVSAVVVSGVTRYYPDCVRAVTLNSQGNDSGITFTVSGYDFYDQPQTQTITGGNGAAVITKKTFQSITSVTTSGSVATTVSVGTADLFGIPTAVYDKTYVDALNWANSFVQDTGTFLVGDTTSPATALTGDVRGTYVPSTSSNGTNRLIVSLLLSPAQLTAGPSTAATTAILGVTPA